MSHSHYRGKVRTDKEIKGPFTEAKDEPYEAVHCLAEAIRDGAELEGHVHEKEDGKVSVLVQVGDMWLELSCDGIVEVGEGGA